MENFAMVVNGTQNIWIAFVTTHKTPVIGGHRYLAPLPRKTLLLT
jgi:hypothetical protein